MLLTRNGDATWGAEMDTSGVCREYEGTVTKATLKLVTHPAGSVQLDQLYALRQSQGYKPYRDVNVVNNRIKVLRSHERDVLFWASISGSTSFSKARDSLASLWDRIGPLVEPSGVRLDVTSSQTLLITPDDEIGVSVQTLAGLINANGFGSGFAFPHSSPSLIALVLWWARDGVVAMSVDGQTVTRPDQLPGPLFTALQSSHDLLKVMGMESAVSQIKPINYAALLRR